MRLRSTLPPTARGTVRPRRAKAPPAGLARQKAANSGPETRVPWSYTFRKSAVRRARNDGEQGVAPPPAGSTGVGVANGLLVTDGQFMTAPCTASRQHCPSVLGLHALTKS